MLRMNGCDGCHQYGVALSMLQWMWHVASPTHPVPFRNFFPSFAVLRARGPWRIRSVSESERWTHSQHLRRAFAATPRVVRSTGTVLLAASVAAVAASATRDAGRSSSPSPSSIPGRCSAVRAAATIFRWSICGGCSRSRMCWAGNPFWDAGRSEQVKALLRTHKFFCGVQVLRQYSMSFEAEMRNIKNGSGFMQERCAFCSRQLHFQTLRIFC